MISQVIAGSTRVLILVVMEEGQRPRVSMITKSSMKVLILVVMEEGQRRH